MKFLEVFAVGVGGFIFYELYRGGTLNPSSVTVPAAVNAASTTPQATVPSTSWLSTIWSGLAGQGTNALNGGASPTISPGDASGQSFFNFTPNSQPLIDAITAQAATDTSLDPVNTINPAGVYGDVTGIGSVANNATGFGVGD